MVRILKRTATALLGLVLMMALLVGCGEKPAVTPTPGPQPAKGVEIGDPAPEFDLPTPDGKTISLSGLGGKPVLLSFWSPSCAHCLVEMPIIQEIYQEWSGKGLAVVTVVLLNPNKDETTATLMNT